MRASGRSVATATTVLALITSLIPMTAAMAGPAKSLEVAQSTTNSVVPGATCSLAGSVRTCHLWALDGTVDLPGLAAVPIRGFALGDAVAPAAPADIPGPALVAVQGETLTVTLHNELATATSLSFPGQDGFVPDPTGASPGGTRTYTIQLSAPGTYIYQAGLTGDGPVNVAMGLAGALVVRPSGAPAQAYAGAASAYDVEALVFGSEIDPNLNAAPSTFDMARFHPTYWLFDGRAYPETSAIEAAAGQRVLLRIVNGGLLNQSIGLLGAHQSIVGASGRPLAWPYEVVAETVPAGSTLDSIVTIPASTPTNTLISVMSAADHLDNAGQLNGSQVAFGGMLTFIHVTPGGSDAIGPSVSSIALSPNPTSSSAGVALTAIGSDAATGGSNVDAAEFYVDDASCSVGVPTAMTLGLPVATVRSLSGTIAAGLAQGVHTVSVRAHDDSGHWGSCSATSLTIDQTGPNVTGAMAGPNPTLGAPTISLTATATDPIVAGSSSSILAAEWFEGIDPGVGNGHAMAATDGTFDTPSEAIRASIATSTLSVGTHTFSIRARDVAGTWGPATTANVLVDSTIFADGFESGTLGAWTSTSGAVTVANVAAMDGTTRGMVATVAGAAAFVTDNTPIAESTYHARFWFNPNGILAGVHTIFDATTSTGASVASIEAQRTKQGKQQIRAVIAKSKGAPATTAWYTLATGAHALEIEWTAGKSGGLRLYVDGSLTQALLGINTGTNRVDSSRLGPSRGLAGATGSEWFDEFISNRSSYIGP